MLEVDLTNFQLRNKTLLQRLSFSLKGGKNLTILGENGAGKSTLAKILCGLYKTKKCVKIDGRFLENLSFKERSQKVNYVPSKFEVYDSFLTVEEFLALSGWKERVEEALLLLELESLRYRFCKELSSGESQRLLLASAWVHQSKITLFDEPTANLDPLWTQKIFTLLKNHFSQKIIITHDLDFAYQLGYPILYLHEGVGVLYSSCLNFFEEKNLEHLYGKSVVKVGSHVVTLL